MRWRRAADCLYQDGDKNEQVQQPAQVLELVEARHGLVAGANSPTRRDVVTDTRLRRLPDASMSPAKVYDDARQNKRAPPHTLA